jgi:ABC-2 type transport system ATP-binding protein
MISSHILSELEEFCDHVGIIEHGTLIFSGTMDQIRQRMGLHAKFRVTVTGEPQRAAEVLGALPQISEVTQGEAFLDVTFHDGQPNDGLDVIAIVPKQLKLDDAFLLLTKGIVH